MMRYKKTTARLKNPSHFQSYKDKDRFEEFLEPIKILEEKGFIFPTQPTGVMSSIHTTVARRGWLKFCSHPQNPVVPVVKKFYPNML